MYDAAEHLQKLKQDGRKVVACLPLYPPVEILDSFGLSPQVLWAPVKGAEHTAARIQSYVCSVAHRAADFIIGSPADSFAALVAYNACDSIRNLPEILTRALNEAGVSPPFFTLHYPQAQPGSTGYLGKLKAEIDKFISRLEKELAVSFDGRAFAEAVDRRRQIRLRSAELDRASAEGRISFAEFAEIIMTCSLLSVDDQLVILDSAVKKANAAEVDDDYKFRIVLSGITPGPRAILEKLRSSGFRIVGNDIAALSRSYAYAGKPTEDPVEYYARRFSEGPPCTTILHTAERRLEYLKKMKEEKRADAFIFIGEKFCEYEYFEFPIVMRELKKIGASSLVIETAIDDEDNVAAGMTRLEAFAELLGEKKAPK